MKFNRRFVTLLLCSIFFSIVPQEVACAAFIPSAKKQLTLTTALVIAAPGIQAFGEALQASFKDTREENIAQKDKKLSKLALLKFFAKKLQQHTFKKELWKKHYKKLAGLKKCFSRRQKGETWKQWRIRTQQECTIFGKENPVFTAAVALWIVNATGSLAVVGYQKLTHKKDSPPPPAPRPQPTVPPAGAAAPVNPQPNPAPGGQAADQPGASDDDEDDDDVELPFVVEGQKDHTASNVAVPVAATPQRELSDEEEAQRHGRYVNIPAIKELCSQAAGAISDVLPSFSVSLTRPEQQEPPLLTKQQIREIEDSIPVPGGDLEFAPNALHADLKRDAVVEAENAERAKRSKKRKATEAEVTRRMTGLATDDPKHEEIEATVRRKIDREQRAAGPVSILAIQHEKTLAALGEILTVKTNAGASGALNAIASNPAEAHAVATIATAAAALTPLGPATVIGFAATQLAVNGGIALTHHVVEPYLKEHPEVRETIAHATSVVRNEAAKAAVISADIALHLGKIGVAALGGGVPTLAHTVATGVEYAAGTSPWVAAGVHGTLLVGAHIANSTEAQEKIAAAGKKVAEIAQPAIEKVLPVVAGGAVLGTIAAGGVGPAVGQAALGILEYSHGVSLPVAVGLHTAATVGAHAYNYLETHPEVKAKVIAARKATVESALSVAQDAYNGYKRPCKELLQAVDSYLHPADNLFETAEPPPHLGITQTVLAGAGDAVFNTGKAALQPGLLPHTVLAAAEATIGTMVHPVLAHAALAVAQAGLATHVKNQVKEAVQGVKEGTKRALWRGAFSTAYFGRKVANLWHVPTNFLASKLTLSTTDARDATQLPSDFPEDTTPRINPKIEDVD